MKAPQVEQDHRVQSFEHQARVQQTATKAPNSTAEAYANAYNDGLITWSDIPCAVAKMVLRLVGGG